MITRCNEVFATPSINNKEALHGNAPYVINAEIERAGVGLRLRRETPRGEPEPPLRDPLLRIGKLLIDGLPVGILPRCSTCVLVGPVDGLAKGVPVHGRLRQAQVGLRCGPQGAHPVPVHRLRGAGKQVPASREALPEVDRALNYFDGEADVVDHGAAGDVDDRITLQQQTNVALVSAALAVDGAGSRTSVAYPCQWMQRRITQMTNVRLTSDLVVSE